MRALLLLAMCTAAGAQAAAEDRVIAAGVNVGSLSFSADGSTIAATCQDRRVRLWDARTGALKRTLNFDQEDGAPALADRADLLAMTGNGMIKIRDLATGETIHQFSGPPRGMRSFVFSRDRQLAAGASPASATGSEYTVQIWDAAGVEQRAVAAGLGGISTMAFSPDGGTLVAAGFDTNLRAWSTRNGELLRLIDELPLAMFAAAFSPDGKYLATAGADRIVYLWDAKTWTIARKLSGQPEMISALAFSPDSRLLMTGGFSELTERHPVKILLWDVNSGKVLRDMASDQIVRSIAFSPDGARAATASQTTIRVWAMHP